MIQLIQLAKTFNTGSEAEIKALKPLDLYIHAGEFTVLIGSNGSGKSTLLNLIAGTYMPDSGRILIDGEDLTALPDYRRSRFIARIFQDPLMGTAPDLSMMDNFRLAALRSKPKMLSTGMDQAFKKKVIEVISRLGMGLETKTDQPIGRLSGGQRQALTLCMATMDSARVLLMDEPSAALDPRSSQRILETARDIITSSGLAAVMVTHNLKDALLYADRLIQMKEGQVIHDYGKSVLADLTIAGLYDSMG